MRIKPMDEIDFVKVAKAASEAVRKWPQWKRGGSSVTKEPTIQIEEPELVRPITPLLAIDCLVIRFLRIGNNPIPENKGWDDSPGRWEVLLIERRNHPKGLALPGGFVEVGETTVKAAYRELEEETGISIKDHIDCHFLTFKDQPDRDPRGHTVSIVYLIEVGNKVNPIGGDDAKNAKFYPVEEVLKMDNICFDHKQIIQEWWG